MLIRRYQAQDNEAVKKLHYAGLVQFGSKPDAHLDSDLDNIEGIYLDNGGEFLVGTEEDTVISIGALKKVTDHQAEIKRIRVRADRQKRGHGQEILSSLINPASGQGYKELLLDTVAGNVAADRLFRKLGFQEIRRDRIGAYDMVFYRKSLD